MIHGSWMSRANSIVIPGDKLDLAMQLILTPLINRLVERGRRGRTQADSSKHFRTQTGENR
jgi:phosphoribulokinase